MIAVKGRIEWRQALDLIGYSVRDETGYIYDSQGRALLCSICKNQLTLDNLGFLTGHLQLCDDLMCHFEAFSDDDAPELDYNTEIFDWDLDDITHRGKAYEVEIGDWFWDL